MTLISAIIPAFNGASRFLDQAMASIFSQSHRELELIVVDDASTDETGRLVTRYPQARYVRRARNGGQAAARNDGAALARGEFIAFLDQDDLWEPSFLEETLNALRQAPSACVVHADGYQVSEQNDVIEYDAAMKHTGSITQLLRAGHDVATSGSLFRKACFDAVGGYDPELRIWEDIDLAIRLAARYELVHLPKPLYRHRLYARNASRDIPSERALAGRKRFLEKHAGSCADDPALLKALARDWAHYFSDLGKARLQEGRSPEARAAFYQALRHDPARYKTWFRFLRSFLS